MHKFYSVLFILSAIPALCVAEEKPAQVMADGWTMVPKAGHNDEFEAALKAHLAYRVEKGDTRVWETWLPVTGDDLNRYLVRSCCDTWAAQDDYTKWSREKLGDHFGETVDPHVAYYAHNFTELDMENNNWPAGTEANFAGVTTWDVKQGKNGQANSAIKAMSDLAKAHDWPYQWSWLYPVGGSNRVLLATAYKNFADMAPPEETFYTFAKKHMEEDALNEMFANFNGAFSGSHYTIWRYSKDLSMPKAED